MAHKQNSYLRKYEINYNSSDNFDVGDWVEIYNSSDDAMDLSLWLLKDEEDEHIFTIPSNTIISPNQYIVFCKDTASFIVLFSEVDNYYGDLGFGLGGGGDQIRLFDSAGSLADFIEYDDGPPWPVEADGGGATLELKNPSTDNANWENWSASEGYGTPGALNSVYSDDI